MKICGIALASLLVASSAIAQDDLDSSIRALSEKLSKEGLSGKLAEAAASDAGVQAIHEKIDFLLARASPASSATPWATWRTTSSPPTRTATFTSARPAKPSSTRWSSASPSRPAP
jgi:hypothetical protein